MQRCSGLTTSNFTSEKEHCDPPRHDLLDCHAYRMPALTAGTGDDNRKSGIFLVVLAAVVAVVSVVVVVVVVVIAVVVVVAVIGVVAVAVATLPLA